MRRATDRCVFLLGREQLELREVPRVQPGPGELVVTVDTATTCGTDVKVFLRGGHPTMLTPPCPFGHEISGTVDSAGAGVRRWRPGDRVIVANSASCGACPACRDGRENLCNELLYLNGAFAERLLVPSRFVERAIHRIPEGLSSRLAALSEPLACVVHGLERMNLAAASHVLVVGGGPIGLMFAFLLGRQGHRATLADPNADRLALGAGLGAEVLQVVDRTAAVPGSPRWDAAVDATGSTAGWRTAIAAVRPGGAVNLFGGCAPGTEVALDTHRLHYQELTLLGSYHHRPASFARAVEILAASGTALAGLISWDCILEEVETALRAMIDRRAVKVAVRPNGADV